MEAVQKQPLVIFPEDFLLGAATASYQIEGAVDVDGRGFSVWDEFCGRPGSVRNNESGKQACDHYHRWREDIELMTEIGLQAYRFSVAWPRIFPEEPGKVNSAGLDFYDRLVDGLLAKKIRPVATLFHWDMPLSLFRRGGWLNRDSVRWFAEYAGTVAARLGDRVLDWITHNEPQCFLGLGHWTGVHAPGLRLGLSEVLLATHHALLAHGAAVRAVRAVAPQPVRIGIVTTGTPGFPSSNTPDDIDAARRATFAIPEPHTWNLTWYLDPIFGMGYPDDGCKAFGEAVPAMLPGDYEEMAAPMDFLGLNLYFGREVRAISGAPGYEVMPRGAGFPITQNEWPVTPQALRWGLRFLHERYRLPLLVTENGCALPDWPTTDGRVHDPQRVDYLSRYLAEVAKAMADGVPVEGYLAWSLMDNFEWAEGYRYRMGLIHVDYQTQKRTLKDSALWLRELIKTRQLAAY